MPGRTGHPVLADVARSGLYVNIVLPPACHADGCLLRTSVSAAHSTAQIDTALSVFRAGRARELGFLTDERRRAARSLRPVELAITPRNPGRRIQFLFPAEKS